MEIWESPRNRPLLFQWSELISLGLCEEELTWCMQKARENGVSPQKAAPFCLSDHRRIYFGKQHHISQPACAIILRTRRRKAKENMWRASLWPCLGRTTRLCMQRATGTEMSPWLTLGPRRLKIDSDEFTQCFTIEGNSNSGISAAHSIKNLPFPLCPRCPSLQMSLLKLSITNCFVSFQ